MSKAIIDKNLLDQPVVKYIVKDYLILDSNSNVVDAARLMKEKRHECIIIVEDKKPMGMLTLKDIVYKVVAEGKDPRKTRLKELISRPLISVDPETKVSDAIKLMVEEDIRRLPVIKSDMVLGVFVLRAIVGDVVEKSITLPDIEVHEGLKCPYCGSVFQTREELSKHIDRVHIGAGLLEGVALRRE